MDAACPEEAIVSNTESTRAPHDEIRLTARETASACCGGPAPDGAPACCARDAELKSVGGAGCGCSTAAAPSSQPTRPRSGCC